MLVFSSFAVQAIKNKFDDKIDIVAILKIIIFYFC